MITMRFKARFDGPSPPFVGKLLRDGASDGGGATGASAISYTQLQDTPHLKCQHGDREFILERAGVEDVEGDVLLIIPRRETAYRLIRRGSRHNTILFTQACDQLCVMCSQPPRPVDDAWLLPLYAEAIELADTGAVIGISGGEPTLYKEELLQLLEAKAVSRPDISFHILSNGQHFSQGDIARLRAIHKASRVVWGVPLYSSFPDVHDAIVVKEGAFERVLDSLYILGFGGAYIELRTVPLRANYLGLRRLASFIAKNLGFVGVWAIMGIEPIGFAKKHREQVFIDHSQFFDPLEEALEIAELYRLPVRLYNMPLCTVPERYHRLCVDSIADWKKKYLPECSTCASKDLCPGFFEWYHDKWRYQNVRPFPAATANLG